METQWIFKPVGGEELITKLQDALNVSSLTAKLLSQRDITTFDEAKSFFRPELKDLHDPFLMKDMEEAIVRLEKAIDTNEKILVYGDYDVDGTTSVALVYSYLRLFYKNIDYYIPNRYEEGYGISYKGIDHAIENGFSLVIALDCGIKAVEKIDYANEKNVDFIICDHHTPGSKLPQAIAVLDPKRKDCNYPFKELSGCGVGFKLIQAYESKHNISVPGENGIAKVLEDFLDLVCVSIASDIVPITGENRTLAFYGLKKLNSSPRIGLKSILNMAGQIGKELTISDLVFKIGPRINAAGRIKSGKRAVELLVSEDDNFARIIGQDIDEYNSTRKNLDAEITQEALAIITNSEEEQKKKTTVLFRKNWHKGVIGIVASRLIETHYRPTIILTESHGMATGSARSVDGFNIYNAIDTCSDLLEGFGGHKYAAGLTMKLENIPEFQRRFEEYVQNTITDQQLTPQIEVDAEIDFASITPQFFKVLKQFAPFGPGNMRPVFVTKKVKDCGMTRLVGSDASHLKLDVMKKGKAISGIAFGMARFYEDIASGRLFDVCYTVAENNFNGKITLQMMVKDIKIDEEQW